MYTLETKINGTYHGYEGKEVDKFFNNKKIGNLFNKRFDSITIFDGSIWIEHPSNDLIKVTQYRSDEIYYFDARKETKILKTIAKLVNFDEG